VVRAPQPRQLELERGKLLLQGVVLLVQAGQIGGVFFDLTLGQLEIDRHATHLIVGAHQLGALPVDLGVLPLDLGVFSLQLGVLPLELGVLVGEGLGVAQGQLVAQLLAGDLDLVVGGGRGGHGGLLVGLLLGVHLPEQVGVGGRQLGDLLMEVADLGA